MQSRNVATAITSFAAQLASLEARIHTTIPSSVSCVFSKGSPPSASTSSVFARRVEREPPAPRSGLGRPEVASRIRQRGHRRPLYSPRIVPFTSTDPLEAVGAISRDAADAIAATDAPSRVRARHEPRLGLSRKNAFSFRDIPSNARIPTVTLHLVSSSQATRARSSFRREYHLTNTFEFSRRCR